MDNQYDKMPKLPQPKCVLIAPLDLTRKDDELAYRTYLNEVAAREVGELNE